MISYLNIFFSWRFSGANEVHHVRRKYEITKQTYAGVDEIARAPAAEESVLLGLDVMVNIRSNHYIHYILQTF